MTKTEAILVLSDLQPTEKVRLIVNTSGVKADFTQTADYHFFWLKKEFHSPWDENQQETDCIQLESSSFAFALAYNSVMEKVETPKEVEYTKEQQEQMFALHYETTQQNHVGYLETSKGE